MAIKTNPLNRLLKKTYNQHSDSGIKSISLTSKLNSSSMAKTVQIDMNSDVSSFIVDKSLVDSEDVVG